MRSEATLLLCSSRLCIISLPFLAPCLSSEFNHAQQNSRISLPPHLLRVYWKIMYFFVFVCLVTWTRIQALWWICVLFSNLEYKCNTCFAQMHFQKSRITAVMANGELEQNNKDQVKTDSLSCILMPYEKV